MACPGNLHLEEAQRTHRGSKQSGGQQQMSGGGLEPERGMRAIKVRRKC